MSGSTEPKTRLPEEDIRIEMCEENDAEEIVHYPHVCFNPEVRTLTFL
jgi:hypothetical protein